MGTRSEIPGAAAAENETRRRRLAQALWLALPPAFCLLVNWRGLRAWFQQDDFAWLGLGLTVHGPRDLLAALFAPMAQGTIRPLSERAFFMLFHSLFGLWASPFRAFVFLTQFANLALLSWIVRRLTGSRLAGLLAAVFWTATSALVVPLGWTSAYNQVLCGFFLLAAFACLLRYIETGRSRYLAGQWAAFVLGLGAQELAAVYPALAASYALCCARRHLRSTMPLFAASGAYGLVHYLVLRGRPADPIYAMHFDPSLPGRLWTYWSWALGASRLHEFVASPVLPWAAPLATGLLTAALAGFALWKIRRREWLALFFLAWFVLLLLPVLPLRNHMSDYYLALPSAGPAMLGAWAAASALRRNWRWRLAAVTASGIFLFIGVLEARLGLEALAERSYRVRTLVFGVARARQSNPGKTIILSGIDNELYWAGVHDRPLRLLGISDVYLAPECRQQIQAGPEELAPFVVPAGLIVRLLSSGRAVVYAVEPRRLRGITYAYLAEARARWAPEEPRHIDVGRLMFAGQLGPSWYNPSDGHRWMPRRATLWLGGPRAPGARLHVSGYCPAAQVAKGPLKLSVSIDGISLPDVFISKGGALFQFAVPLPHDSAGKPRIEISLEVDRTFTAPPDVRELGLAFGTFEVRE